ncbi:Aminodeoxychorismate lyase [Marasmius tenuissimus]|uniref:Aminodeoxychorismate lyase n=1 Tax=Marasmius tenuissimus TaxID=585030 RepID=A0ABR3A7L0_9AGAR
MYQLLSSTRYDEFLLSLAWNNNSKDNDTPSPFLQLPYHHDRLLEAAKRHGWNISLSYLDFKKRCWEAIETTNSSKSNESLKVRITLSSSGLLDMTTSPVPPLTEDPTSDSFFLPPSESESGTEEFTLIMDTSPTPSSLFTSTKTTQRSHYDAARARAGLQSYADPIDVLLYNEEGMITETSITNVAFYRGGGWVTPVSRTGCLEGVMRTWLLERGRIKEDVVTKESVEDGEEVLVFNGVAGCRRARIKLNRASTFLPFSPTVSV